MNVGKAVALTFVLTFLVASGYWILIMFIVRTSGTDAILWRTETGVTCHVDKLYPQADCKALLAGLGARLSTVKVDR